MKDEVHKQLTSRKVEIEIDKQSMKKAQKANSLERALEVPIPQQVYDRLQKEMEAGVNG